MHVTSVAVRAFTFAAGLALAATAAAQGTSSATADRPAAKPFAIVDNSFFVEEAFNQEPGIFQNIFGILRLNGRWSAAFTQEWPVGSKAHQLSYTLAWSGGGSVSGIGDTLINYRYQVLEEGPGRPAFAPRASAILPTGNSEDGLGAGSPGLQIDLPFSKQAGDVYLHWNAGTTWLFRSPALVSPFVAGSAIVRVRPMLHAMLETVVSSEANEDAGGVSHDTSVTLSPGFRAGWNVGREQIVIGGAVPVTWRSGEVQKGIFGYFSYELPFAK